MVFGARDEAVAQGLLGGRGLREAGPDLLGEGVVVVDGFDAGFVEGDVGFSDAEVGDESVIGGVARREGERWWQGGGGWVEGVSIFWGMG